MFISLNGTQIRAPQPPRGFTVQKFNLTKARRNAAGLMILDVIAVKRKFLFNYRIINRADIEVISNILFSGESFYELVYDYNEIQEQATVYSGATNQEAFRTGGNDGLTGWYWQNFTFDLIER